MPTARSKMRMRAVVQYNAEAGLDAFNQPQAPSWTTSGDPVACFAWPATETDIVDDNKNVVVHGFGCLWPRQTGITDEDRFSQIQDRLDRVIFAGPLYIETISVYDRSHLKLTLIRRDSGPDVDL
jgi:hypothetical protein